MKRRDCLKGTAALLAGATLPACDGGREVVGQQAGPQSGPAFVDRASMYDAGATPIETSGWTSPDGVLPGHAALAADIDTDVAIVGAGLAGSSLALHLAEAGVQVTVLESRQPGWGASGRNAGHVLPTLRDLELFRRFPDGGAKFLAMFREHHRISFDLAARHGIDCDAVQSGYLHATNRSGVFERLQASSRYWSEQQGQQVEYLQGADMRAMTGSDYYRHGVLYRSGGRVNPYRFTNGMIDAAIRLGTRVFGDTEALALAPAGERWRIRTANGIVTAARVVFCTNAYPTAIVPGFGNNFYPLTAYALSTQPLPEAARALLMPGGATLAQEPVDLNPFVIDRHGRIITSGIPDNSRPDDAAWHFRHHLDWIHRTWPAARDMDIRMDDYWTGRVALREVEFPGVFRVRPGVFGLMHFNAWGNLMAPLMGKLFADGLARERLDALPFPLETPRPVADPGRQSFWIRSLLIPAARAGQKLGII